MVIQRTTESEFADQIADAVAARDQSIDTRIGSIRDIQISPIAGVLKDQNDNIVYLSQLTSLKNAERFFPDDLNDFAYNEAIVRWDGAASLAIASFARILPPTANILVPVNFPLATTIDPETGAVVEFRTIESQVMYGPATTPASAYYNGDTEKYEIDVAVASVVKGESTNVGAFTITQFRRPFPAFDEVYNKLPTSSGRGLETNTEVARRYQMQVQGSQIASPTGLQRFLLDNFSGIIDAFIVYGESEYLLREDEDAGAVDAWVLGSSPSMTSYTVNYPGIETLIPLPKQPVVEVVSVSDTGTTYVEGTDYEVVTGEGIFAYSNRGTDGIRFLAGGSAPTLNDAITISYNYNTLINTMSAYYRQSESYVMGSDVLFRWSQDQQIEIEANLKVSSGNPESVRDLVKERVLNYINGLLLGEDVEEFDIDSEVARVFGVDNWTYITLAVEDGSGVADITIPPNQYARIEAANLVINLVS
jgi:hypothetical protein